MTKPNNKLGEKKSAPLKLPVIAKANSAGATNKVSGSLVKCEVKIEQGEWISPASCAVFHIDSDAKFPEIIFEFSTDQPGPYEWSWEIRWNVLACPQKKGKSRFKPKATKLYSDKGKFTSDEKKWVADLNGKIVGGELTVKVKAGNTNFVRKVIINGEEPGKQKITEELTGFSDDYIQAAQVAKKIFQQESKFLHFYSDEQPLVSFDNGYGLGQATNPVPTYEQVWNWKKHVDYIVKTVITEKRKLAKKYLDRHGNYTDDDLEMETLVYYNGANYHYLVWDATAKKWAENKTVLCDPQQSNTGWNTSLEQNAGKTLDQLRKGEGSKPSYTGRCYAEHVKHNEAK